MTTAGTFQRGGFWASTGAGLLFGLLIVVLVFRLTSPGESTAAPTAATPAITVLDTTTDETSVDAADADESSDVAAPPQDVTTEPTTTEPTAADEPTVNITKRIGACKYGPQCLIADFNVVGFSDRPAEFVCEFQDGSRYTFSFDGESSQSACSTGTVPSSITIEVDGVRSDTITNP